jgi:hypothetical protein
MPTIYKAQLTEPETPMLEIWERMFNGLIPNAPAILDFLGYYAEHDLPIPNLEGELTEEEKEELNPIARVLMEAAIKSVQMTDGVLVSTLDKVAKNPSLFFESQLPAAVQWEIAKDYQRGDEKPGAFGMDIWGDEQTRCTHLLETPAEANIKRAAEASRRRIQKRRRSGRPFNPANWIVAESLGKLFRPSGHSIVRRRESTGKMFDEKVIYAEKGPFYDFLELVLPPLRFYLSEQRLSPVTIESVVRFAAKKFS